MFSIFVVVVVFWIRQPIIYIYIRARIRVVCSSPSSRTTTSCRQHHNTFCVVVPLLFPSKLGVIDRLSVFFFLTNWCMKSAKLAIHITFTMKSVHKFHTTHHFLHVGSQYAPMCPIIISGAPTKPSMLVRSNITCRLFTLSASLPKTPVFGGALGTRGTEE